MKSVIEKVLVVAAALTALNLSASLSSFGQAAAADCTISVKTVEAFGRPVPDADLTLSGPEGVGGVASVIKITGKTNNNGIHDFNVKRAGTYTITASKFPYRTESKKIVVNQTDKTANVEIEMRAEIARFLIHAMDDETNEGIAGATIVTERADGLKDNMFTDSEGRAYVLIKVGNVNSGQTNYSITVSHRDYETLSRNVTISPTQIKDHFVPFRMSKKTGLKTVIVECLEDGTRAPIMGATITLDGGQNRYFAGTTDGRGRYIFRVPGGSIYKIIVTSSLYESVNDTADFVGADSPTVIPKTFVLQRKDDGKEVRRALLVKVRYQDKAGNFKPISGATITGVGLSTFTTDANGNCVMFHKVPPGETISIGASKMGFEPGKGDVLIRDK